jgi:two-component system response regulator HupR/HoxA
MGPVPSSDGKMPTVRPIILVVDDEPRSLQTLRRSLDEEFEIITAGSAEEAGQILATETPAAILCDQRMPGTTGVAFLKQVREVWPEPVRMIISGYTDSADILAAVNEAGIYRFIPKPWDPEDLLDTVRGAVRLHDLQRENHAMSVEMKVSAPHLEKMVAEKRSLVRARFGFSSIVHADGSPVAESIALAGQVAEYDISVLITGESGTGKELLARAIHYNSPRAGAAFVMENCGALPDQLLESELFGCKKGAFTGAYEDRIGLFEQAHGGTIFLDEIGETSPAFQVKLLRVLQEGEIRPLGARLPRQVDVRVIAATNRDLEEEVRAGRFRQDLYYRLCGFPIHLSPLRDRPDDIPLLAEMLLGEAMRRFGKPVQGFSPDAMALLRAHPWPGNVRELRNEVQRMVALARRDVLEAELVSPAVRRGSRGVAAGTAAAGTLRARVEVFEAEIIAEALVRHGWNVSRVAAELGLSRVGLRGKMARHGLERPPEREAAQ